MEKNYGVAPMTENLVSVVNHINELVPKVDVVIVTGDICANGLPDELEFALLEVTPVLR